MTRKTLIHGLLVGLGVMIAIAVCIWQLLGGVGVDLPGMGQ